MSKKKRAELSLADILAPQTNETLVAPVQEKVLPLIKAPPLSPPIPLIKLEEFRYRSGIRSEYFSGFARHVSLEYGPDTQERKTLDGWKNAYGEYSNRPVIG